MAQKGLAMATFQINSDFINEIKDLIAKADKSQIKLKLHQKKKFY